MEYIPLNEIFVSDYRLYGVGDTVTAVVELDPSFRQKNGKCTPALRLENPIIFRGKITSMRREPFVLSEGRQGGNFCIYTVMNKNREESMEVREIYLRPRRTLLIEKIKKKDAPNRRYSKD